MSELPTLHGAVIGVRGRFGSQERLGLHEKRAFRVGAGPHCSEGAARHEYPLHFAKGWDHVDPVPR